VEWPGRNGHVFLLSAPRAPAAAKFLDARMRLGVRGLAGSSASAGGSGAGGGAAVAGAAGSSGEDELDSLLDRTMTLFRCIHGKDVFEAFYKKVSGTFASLYALLLYYSAPRRYLTLLTRH
jgi:hypothetical protein